MRFPRPRFTVRWLMIAVAIVGSTLGILMERRARFLKIAESHKLSLSDPSLRYCLLFGGLSKIAYHEEMVSKYERAARYPWLPVEPDLPTLPDDPKTLNPRSPVKDAELPVLPDRSRSQSPFELDPK